MRGFAVYRGLREGIHYPLCTGVEYVRDCSGWRSSAQGDPRRVRQIDGTAAEPGTELTLGQVLLVERDGGEVVAGAPFVANARVLAVVEGETRGPKIRVFKKKRRKGMRRTKGHRAVFTRVRITDIQDIGAGVSEPRSSPEPQPPLRIVMAHKKGQGSSRNGRDSSRSGSA